MSDKQIASLYIVATPIGNLADMTPRAIDVLRHVDLIAAEDTRHSGLLLQHFAINTPCQSLHEHNEEQKSQHLLHRLEQGESIALISDAGTPLISDPGYNLVSLVRKHGFPVIPVPGCCAAIAALSVSGLPADHFRFEGFLPHKAKARQQTLSALCQAPQTLIFYESPRRLQQTIQDIVTIFGSDRRVCMARELTKLHETVVTKPAGDLLQWLMADRQQQKGECVLLIEGQRQPRDPLNEETARVLGILLEVLPVKQAASVAASILNIRKNSAYTQALNIQKKQ